MKLHYYTSIIVPCLLPSSFLLTRQPQANYKWHGGYGTVHATISANIKVISTHSENLTYIFLTSFLVSVYKSHLPWHYK